MSIQTEITRLNTAKANILTSISNKGVDTSSVNTLNDIPPLIDSISTEEDLSNELNEQNTLLSNQEVTIEDIKLALQGKGSGGEVVLQEKTITPTTSQQNVIADSGYNGLSKVVVNAVDSSIDSDIKATNIRKGIDILGVTGTLEEKEDLTQELTTQETLLNNQVSKLDIAINTLKNKASGGNTDIEDAMLTRELSGNYINNRVTSIGTEALRATQISSLHCEEVLTVGGEAIRDCKNLVSIYLPKCKTLQGYSVGICPLLERVELNSIETIQAYSFYSCPKLTTFIIRNTSKVCSLANVNAFNSSGISSGTGYIYVPDTLLTQYQESTNWSNYASQIKPLSELEV